MLLSIESVHLVYETQASNYSSVTMLYRHFQSISSNSVLSCMAIFVYSVTKMFDILHFLEAAIAANKCYPLVSSDVRIVNSVFFHF